MTESRVLANAIRLSGLSVVAGTVWILAGCAGFSTGGAPPSQARAAIDYPHDHRIFFRDEERKHVVTLFDDGRYLFKSGTDSEGVLDSREGRWNWKKAGDHEAVLGLDSDSWKLTFVSPDTAMAVNEAAAGRTYVFQFEPI